MRSLLGGLLPLVVRKRLASMATVRGCGGVGCGGGNGDAALAVKHAQPMPTTSQLATVLIVTLPFMLATQIGQLAVPCMATVGWVRCAHPPITLLFFYPLKCADAMHASLARRFSGFPRSVTSSRSP